MNNPIGTLLVRTAPVLLLTACGGTGEWKATTWGEDYIEVGIPAGEFEDGCNATFSTFEVEITEALLLDGNDEVAGDVGSGRYDVTIEGPQDLGTADVKATFYDTARFTIAPAGGDSVHAIGEVTCGMDTKSFDWSFDTSTTYDCEPEDLTIAANGTSTTELTVHGDHFFYDSLEEDAVVRGQAIVDADADADGVVTLAELAAVDIAGLGYNVGPYSDVTNLEEFVVFLTKTLGHVDGEGHCQVDL